MAGPIIHVEGLVKSYGSSIRALDGLDLTVQPGSIYALLGPNGAGKTTLIRVLATLLTPDGGMARVAGIDVQEDPPAVRARIGLAGQYAAVDELLTGRENVEMVARLYGLRRREARRRAVEVLGRIGLTSAADRQVKTYSGGMRRRLDLAASLVGRPEVLFLDEPTTGLDPASRMGLWTLIGELTDAGTSILLTTQNLDEADRLADHIAVIDHGRVISEGTADQLKDQIGGAVIEVAVPAGGQPQALAALRHVGARPPSGDRHHSRVILAAPHGARTLAEALAHLDAAGISPSEAALRRPTLDDVFLTLTSHGTSHAEPGTVTA